MSCIWLDQALCQALGGPTGRFAKRPVVAQGLCRGLAISARPRQRPGILAGFGPAAGLKGPFLAGFGPATGLKGPVFWVVAWRPYYKLFNL